jgi:hypothetical protein
MLERGCVIDQPQHVSLLGVLRLVRQSYTVALPTHF